ncbi:MAG: O-antigen ligase family protein [Ardenticatenaceae bacterium]|nr:O-antigen ligase family protein [Ardenticatenaceae bacterium]
MSRWRSFSHLAFGLLIFLLLASHASESGGPFTWLALPLPTAVAIHGWQIGTLTLLPIVVFVGWWLGNRSAPFCWGETAVTLPVAAFSLLVLVRLTPATAHLAALLALFWFVYLFLANHPQWQAKWLWRILAIVLLVQGVVAVVQFLLQRELGLAWLGEPRLDLLVEGTSVAQRDGQNWLRAYGLNSHPNQLGLLLTSLILLVWPQRARAKDGLWRGLFWLALSAGFAGLLVSLSRSAWLALGGGGLVLVWPRGAVVARSWREFVVPTSVLLAGILLFALVYGDLMASRFVALDSPLEQRSLWERQRDLGIALHLVGERPFLGTGPGHYLAAAQTVDPAAVTVHNVPLLVAAELGLLGLGLWLTFWLWPLWRYGRSPANRVGTAVWLALILMAMVHPEPTLFLPKGSVLWGIAAAQWSGGAA